jgi:hypothetical protein
LEQADKPLGPVGDHINHFLLLAAHVSGKQPSKRNFAVNSTLKVSVLPFFLLDMHHILKVITFILKDKWMKFRSE